MGKMENPSLYIPLSLPSPSPPPLSLSFLAAYGDLLDYAMSTLTQQTQTSETGSQNKLPPSKLFLLGICHSDEREA